MFDMGHAVMAWTLMNRGGVQVRGARRYIPVLLRRRWRPRRCGSSLSHSTECSRRAISATCCTNPRVGQALVLLRAALDGLAGERRRMRRREVIASVVLRSGLGGTRGVRSRVDLGLEGTAAGIAALGASAPWIHAVVCRHVKDRLELTASAAAISVFCLAVDSIA